jgi:hypothetical protein
VHFADGGLNKFQPERPQICISAAFGEGWGLWHVDGWPARVLVRNWCGAAPRNSTLGLGTQWLMAYARRGRRAVELPLSRGNRIEQCVPMAKFDSPYDRVRKLPKQFKPLRAYEEERRRGVAHTPEYDEQMRVLKEEFQRWLLAE